MWHTAGRGVGRYIDTGFGWEIGIKRSLGRPRHRWRDNTKMYDREIGHRLNSTRSGERLLEGSAKHSNELPGFKSAGNWTSCRTISFQEGLSHEVSNSFRYS